MTQPQAVGPWQWGGNFADGSTHNVKLQMRGTSIKVFVDGVERMSVTDSSITAAGRAGVYARSYSMTDTWGRRIDNFTENSAQITLQAGRAYDIRMEYYDAYGGAVAKLLWSSASQPQEVIPQSQLYGCWKTTGQFVKDFYSGALGRQPTASELQGWTSRLAQAQGGAALVGEARALGRSLFASAEYEGRGRTNPEYVGDLYRAYLQRDPAQDQSGFNFWLGVVNGDPANGRENARVGERAGDCGSSRPGERTRGERLHGLKA